MALGGTDPAHPRQHHGDRLAADQIVFAEGDGFATTHQGGSARITVGLGGLLQFGAQQFGKAFF